MKKLPMATVFILSLFAIGVMATTSVQVDVPNDGLLSMDLLIDDGWIYAVDDTVATDPDDVFLEPDSASSGLYTVFSLPTSKIYLPKNLDVDLENTQFYSDPYWSANQLGGSRLFLNSSANAGTFEAGDTSNATVTTQLSFSGDYGEAKLTSAAGINIDTRVMWQTQCEEDRDADGICDETGDEEWLTTINGDEWFVIHMAMASDAASTSTDNWASIELVFKTTTGYYTYEIRGYEYAGDTDVTETSVSNGERANFYSLGASTTFEHLIYMFNIGDVITDDTESPSVVGLDRIEYNIQIDSASASKYITLRNYNICVFREKIGITDSVNDASDFTYDSSGIPGYFTVDCDLPESEITDNTATTDDTYDNLLDIEHAIHWRDGNPILKAPLRKIKFVSDASYEMELDPTTLTTKSLGYNTEFNGYLVKMDATYDWGWLDYGGNPTTYISWTASSSKLMFEWELEYDELCYAVDADDDPAIAIYRDANSEGGYVLQGIEQTAELISAWNGQADDSAVTDILLTEPSQTLGGQPTVVMLKLYMRTSPVSPTPSPIAVSSEGNASWLSGLAIIFGAITSFFSFRWLKGKK